MTQATREKLARALIDNMHPIDEDVTEIYEVAWGEVETLEPLIDDIEEQGYLRGRFQGLLEQAYLLHRLEEWAKLGGPKAGAKMP